MIEPIHRGSRGIKYVHLDSEPESFPATRAFLYWTSFSGGHPSCCGVRDGEAPDAHMVWIIDDLTATGGIEEATAYIKKEGPKWGLFL